MIEQLVGLLEESRRRGFLGPGPVEFHLDHARAFAVPGDGVAPARALDLGAGGGLPGLVLAATVWPETHWTFVDAQLRRTAFLEDAVDELGLADRVEVVFDRAEEVGRDPERRGTYDLVVARSFGAPCVVAECGAPLLVPGGRLLVSEPPHVDIETRWPSAGVALVGLGPARSCQVDTPSGPVHLAELQLVGAVEARYPRRVGIPAKRPLF